MLLSRCRIEWRTSLGVSVSVAPRHGSEVYFLTGKICLKRGKTFVTCHMARDVKSGWCAFRALTRGAVSKDRDTPSMRAICLNERSWWERDNCTDSYIWMNGWHSSCNVERNMYKGLFNCILMARRQPSRYCLFIVSCGILHHSEVNRIIDLVSTAK